MTEKIANLSTGCPTPLGATPLRDSARRWLLPLLLVIPLGATADPPLSATDAWVRAAPPGASMMAGYLTLHNATREPMALVSVSSTRFERVALHRSTVTDGVAHMQAVERVDVPARGSAEFAPGGLHLMLHDPVGPVRDGDTVDLTLTFDSGWTLDLTVPVRRPH